MSVSETKAREILVLNQSDQEVTIDIEKSNGKNACLTIPRTWVGQDLTIQHRFEEIEEAPAFRRAKAQQLIKQITREEYDRLMKQPGAEEERKRLLNPNQFSTNAVEEKGNVEVEITGEDDGGASEAQIIRGRLANYETPQEQVNEFRILVNSGKINKDIAADLVEFAQEQNNRGLLQELNRFDPKTNRFAE